MTRHIQARELLPLLFGRGKESAIDTSLRMGRHRSFLSTYLAYRKMPNLELTSEVMNTIDKDVIVRDRSTGEEIVIDPPPPG